jgi:hypothetical protein
MTPPRQDESSISSPESATTCSTLLSVPPTTYLTVPTTRPSGEFLSLLGPIASGEDDFDLHLLTPQTAITDPVPSRLGLSSHDNPLEQLPSQLSPRRRLRSPARGVFVSVYSTSSVDTEYSAYSNPPAKLYRIPSFQNMSSYKISPVCH